MDFINRETMRPLMYRKQKEIENELNAIHCIDYPKTKLNQMSLIINLDGQRLDKIPSFVVHSDDDIITSDRFEFDIKGALHVSSFIQISGLNCYMDHINNIHLSDDAIRQEYNKYIDCDFNVEKESNFITDIIYPYELMITTTVSY